MPKMWRLVAAPLLCGFDLLAASAFMWKPMTAGNRMASCYRGKYTTRWYFDDLSRKQTVAWSPNGNGPTVPNDDVANAFGEEMAREKAEAIKRILHGHDVESASSLSESDVERETKTWARKTGLVGTNKHHSPYGDIAGMRVCGSSTIPGCIAGFWNATVDVIGERSDRHGVWDKDGIERSRLHMILFPNCAEIYDYRTMNAVHAAMNICKDSSRYFGSKFSSRIFHPRYKNSPKAIEPMRHSPFPVFGLHFPGEDERTTERLAHQLKNVESESKRPVRADVDYVPQLDERRRSLEKIFGSAAASPPDGKLSVRGPGADDGMSGDSEIEVTMAWMNRNRFKEGSPLEAATIKQPVTFNRALQFADTIQDRWIVSDSDVAENVYADLWNAISDLYDLGNAVANRDGTDGDVNPVRNALNQTYLLDVQDNVPTPPVVSTMFIATRFHNFNALGFKKFAVSANAALKHLTAGKMFMELFHPEFVGKDGYHHDFRRSPFPSIQICHKL